MEQHILLLELIGLLLWFVACGLVVWSAWLAVKRKASNFKVDIVTRSLVILMFIVRSAYSDNQVTAGYYIVEITNILLGIYGLRIWQQTADTNGQIHDIRLSERNELFLWATGTVIVAIVYWFAKDYLYQFAPTVFPDTQNPLEYKYVEIVGDIFSYSSYFLLINRRLEGWIYYVINCLVYIYLFYAEYTLTSTSISDGIRTTLYVIVGVIGIIGWREWNKFMQQQAQHPAIRES